MVRKCAAVVLTAMLAGCSYTDAVPYGPNDTTTKGVRVPQMRPLLVIVNSQASVMMVPDTDRGYAIQFGNFLAKNDCEITLDAQQLTKLHCVQDSTAIPTLIVTAAKDLLSSALEQGKLFGGVSPEGRAEVNKVQIFAIDFDNQGNISGLRPLLSPSLQRSFIDTPGGTAGTNILDPGRAKPPAGDGLQQPKLPAKPTR